MTQIPARLALARSVARGAAALFATSALIASSAAAAPAVPLTAAVARSGDAAPQLILAAAHKKKHAATKAGAHKATAHKAGGRHRRGHHAATPAADETADVAATGASGRLVDVKTGGETYKVKKGDTLATVADKLGADADELKTLNKIKGVKLRPGQVIKAPGATAKAYEAARGDTVAAVAKRFGVSEKALKTQNGFSRRGSALKAGQRLILPEGYRDRGAPKAEAAPASRRGQPRAAGLDETYVAEPPGRSVTGRVTEVAGPPRTYRVRRGDTLEKVADKLGVSTAQLKKDNHLRKNLIRPGQTLRAPGGTVKAYVVAPSDTIFSIARRFGVSIAALRAANGMGRRGTIRTGEKLRLPAGYRDHGPQSGTETAPPRYIPSRPQTYTPPAEEAIPTAPSGGGARPGGPQPYSPTPGRPYVPPVVTPGTGPALAPQSSPAPTDAQVSEIGRGKFQWPLRGEILSDFGPKAAGQRNDGINIQANTGDPVRASAAGDVVYAGDQVPGYGNLVLIAHADGWVTAYSHLSRVEVKMQQKVTQGQEIGQAGSTGGAAEPQLHFEVRYRPNNLDRAKPIDPRLVLPK